MQPMASGSKPVRRALAAGSLGCSRADKVPGQCAQQQHVDYQMPGSESQVLVRASQPCSNCMGPQSAGTELIAWVYSNSFTGLPERRRSGKVPGRNVTLDAGGLGGMLSGAGQSAPYRQLRPGGAVSGDRGRPHRLRIYDKFQRRSPRRNGKGESQSSTAVPNASYAVLYRSRQLLGHRQLGPSLAVAAARGSSHERTAPGQVSPALVSAPVLVPVARLTLKHRRPCFLQRDFGKERRNGLRWDPYTYTLYPLVY